jgi:ATP-binding cassette subfamily B protein
MVEEDICGMRTIQTFGQEKNRLKRFDQLNEKVRESGKKAQIYSGILMPLLRILDNLCYLFVTVYGALLASRGAISVGMIQTFLLYTRNFQRPVNTIATQLNLIQSALAGADRIFQLLDNPETEETYASTLTGCTPKITFRHGPKIEFCDLSFKYSEESPVLNNISFEINENETVALVGATGAGKSTIVDLLARFFEPDSGCIKIDGKEIQTIPLPHLRSLMSIVLQESFLFSESIGYNIGYGKSTAKQSEIVHVAQLANIEDFIERQPNRYDQIVNRQELGISHGQKQLVTIARALLTESPILILDEATSSIDTDTERKIQEALNTVLKGRTSFIIAHRLSTIKECDCILYIGNKGILERGTHEELLEKNGLYAALTNAH